MVFRCLRSIPPEEVGRAAVAPMTGPEMQTALTDLAAALSDFGTDNAFARQVATLAANPTTRVAWKMKEPGKTDSCKEAEAPVSPA